MTAKKTYACVMETVKLFQVCTVRFNKKLTFMIVSYRVDRYTYRNYKSKLSVITLRNNNVAANNIVITT